MKIVNYKCNKCSTIMNFQIRDIGRMPETIGCKTKGCKGQSIEFPSLENDFNAAYSNASSKKIDGIFIRPGSKDEWDGIKHQLKHEVQQKYSEIKIRERMKILDHVVSNIRTFVANGGLIHLPISYFTTTKKQSVD